MTLRDGRVPMSYGRDRHPDVAMEFPVGRGAGGGRVYSLVGEDLYLNTLVSGGKGKGKTAGVILPFLRFVVSHPQRCGALVLDVKGDLTPYIVQWARACGREEDVVVLDPHGDHKIRMFPGSMPAAAIASTIVTAAVTIAGGMDPREAFWLQSAEELVKNYVLLLRTHANDMTRPVGVGDLLHLLGQDAEVRRMVATVLDNPRAAKTSEERYTVDYLRKYFVRHNDQDGRVKASIEAEINRFLHDFSGYDMCRTFDPRRHEKAAEIEDIINDGMIVVLHMPQSAHGEMARFVGLMLKARFYSSVMRRITDETLEQTRPVFFICDEYQNFLTVGAKSGSDDQFAAMCRQARAGMVCATQELGALYAAAGDRGKAAVNNLIQNMQNQIMLRQDITDDLGKLFGGKGLTDVGCLRKLRPFEALLYRDRDTDVQLIELPPCFADWGHAAQIRVEQASDLARRRDAALAEALDHDGDIIGNRILLAGTPGSGKSRVAESIAERCAAEGVAALVVCGRHELARGRNLVAELAERCSYDKVRMESAVVVLDDADALSDNLSRPGGAMYHAAQPFIERRRVEYGRFRDLVDLGRVTVISTATLRDDGRGGKRVRLPGLMADAFGETVVELGRNVERERDKDNVADIKLRESGAGEDSAAPVPDLSGYVVGVDPTLPEEVAS